ALVPIEHADLGTEITVRSNVGEVTARVVERPFIDPKKQTPKTDLRKETTKSY
ncbi:MAG: glycine cleavage system protein T, partial [Rubrobacter sp.]|nr:glycine cleavage system protein T [Rubrobacter sp.]